jgi:hypothetical protein
MVGTSTDGTPAVYLDDFSRAGLPRQIVKGSGYGTLRYATPNRLVDIEYTQRLLAGTTVTNHFDSLGHRDSLSALNTTNPLLQHSFSYVGKRPTSAQFSAIRSTSASAHSSRSSPKTSG